MKKSLFVSLLCIFLFCINSVAEGTQTAEDFKLTQSIWDQLFDETNEKISRLETLLDIEKEQRQEFNSKINEDLNNLTKFLNDRVDKVEKTGSILETNNIAKSFKDTIYVLNKKISEMEKGFDDLEVSVNTIKKIYHVSQKPLETLMKVIDEQAAVINKINERLEKQEKMLLVLGKDPEGREAHIESDKKPEMDTTGLEEKIVTRHKKTVEDVKITPVEVKGFKAIGNDFYVRNVVISEFGNSTSIKGEIKNDSRKNLSSAKFGLKVLGNGGDIIVETEFTILNIDNNEIKPFDEIIRKINPSQVSEYEITFKYHLN